MAFELEALIGHLFVVGGRTIKTTPPGALCEVAPKKAARGRELDTFFALVLPAGNVAPNTFYEQMSLMAAERFFSNSGSVTAALRDVFNTLNSNLFEHNVSGRKRYEAHMIAVVMRGKDLYIARAGAATLILRQQGENKTIPDVLSDDAKLYKPALGVQPIPEVEMSRLQAEAGNRILLADASIREIPPEKLNQSLSSANIEQVLDELKMLVTLQIQLMAIEFVPPEQPATVPAVTGQSSAVLLAEIAAARAKTSTQTTSAVAENEDIPSPSSPRPKRESPQERLKQRTQDGIENAARSAGTSLTRVGTLAAKLFGTEPSARQRRRNSTLIAIAVVLIPTALVAIVMLSWVGNVGQTAYEECVDRATNAATLARSLPSDNRVPLIAAWNTTLQIISECEDLNPDFNDPLISTARIEAQTAIDALSSISRRAATPIWIAPESGANIREVILQGLDLYILESNRSVVYRVQLNETGLGAIAFQPLTFMSLGASLEGSTVGRIIGIAADDTRIVAVDERGQLISCRPLSINTCSIQQLQGWELLNNPIRIELWQSALYILDIGSEQIWRFRPVGNTENYLESPTEFFATGERPANLANAADFAIGRNNVAGTIFVLYADGTMTRHFGSQNTPFLFSGFPDTLDRPEVATTQAMYLNDSAFGTGFYVISRPTRTIYFTTAAGTFQNAFRVQDENQFERLNDVVADAEAGIIYAASGNTIFGIQEE